VAGSLGRRALAELLGTALLVTAVVGSGIAASRLSPNDVGLELFENAVATGAALVAIILAVGPVSGAHLDPVITLLDRVFGGVSTTVAAIYIVAQVAGAIAGAVLANLMFSLPALEVSTKVRTGGGLWLGEVVATFGLALVVFGVVRSGRSGIAPFAVGAYITGAYFFTSSTASRTPRSRSGGFSRTPSRGSPLLGRPVHRLPARRRRHRRGRHLGLVPGRHDRCACGRRAPRTRRRAPDRAERGRPARGVTPRRVSRCPQRPHVRWARPIRAGVA